MLEDDYIRIERVHKGEIFLSLEKDGKRCFPVPKSGIQAILTNIVRNGNADEDKKLWSSMYKHEPDIWDAIFEAKEGTTAADIVDQFNVFELPPKGQS